MPPGAAGARRPRPRSLSRSRSYSSLMRREQEDLVVHREPERDAEHQDRREDVDRAGRGEAEEPGEVALLEDPDHGAERRGEAEHVEQRAPSAGTSRLPVIRNSRTNVASAIMPSAHGSAAEHRRPWCRRARPTGRRRRTRTARGRADVLDQLPRPRPRSARSSGTTDSHVSVGSLVARSGPTARSVARRDLAVDVDVVAGDRVDPRRRRGCTTSFASGVDLVARVDGRRRGDGSTASGVGLAGLEVLPDLVGGRAARDRVADHAVVEQAGLESEERDRRARRSTASPRSRRDRVAP